MDIVPFILLSATTSSGMTYTSIGDGAYDDDKTWDVGSAPGKILITDTVVISHEVQPTNNIDVEGVLNVKLSGTFYGFWQVHMMASGILIQDGSIELDVVENLIFFVPNSFTPNGDESNNTFTPVFTSGYDPDDYSLTIYNKRGELIFESRDANFGWDGTQKFGGIAQDGTYIWKIEFHESMTARRHSKVGHVNLFQ